MGVVARARAQPAVRRLQSYLIVLLTIAVFVGQAQASPLSNDAAQFEGENTRIDGSERTGEGAPHVAGDPIRRDANDDGWSAGPSAPLPPQAPIFPGSPVSPGPSGGQLEARLTTPDRAHGTGGKAWYSNPFGYSPEARLPSTVTGIPLATPMMTPAGSPYNKPSSDIDAIQMMPKYTIPGSNTDRTQAVFKVAHPELMGSSRSSGIEPSSQNRAASAGPSYALPAPDLPPVPLQIPESSSSTGVVRKDCPAEKEPCDRSELPVVTGYSAPVEQYSSGHGMDKAIEYSNGIRCFVCGDVDSQGNVIVGCPAKTGSVKDWVYANKIRTWVCPSGCLTIKDDKTRRYAMMCHHTGESKLGYRLANPEKNDSRISRCYYGGCNGDNLDSFLGRAADSAAGHNGISRSALAVIASAAVGTALI